MITNFNKAYLSAIIFIIIIDILHGDTHFSEFLPAIWRQKSTGTDMEQNYVTVSLCIGLRHLGSSVYALVTA